MRYCTLYTPCERKKRGRGFFLPLFSGVPALRFNHVFVFSFLSVFSSTRPSTHTPLSPPLSQKSNPKRKGISGDLVGWVFLFFFDPIQRIRNNDGSFPIGKFFFFLQPRPLLSSIMKVKAWWICARGCAWKGDENLTAETGLTRARNTWICCCVGIHTKKKGKPDN